jgi:hypothetical protein
MIEIYPPIATSICRMTDHVCNEDIGEELRKTDISKVIKLIKELATAIGNNI